jgi:hypothetical protein
MPTREDEAARQLALSKQPLGRPEMLQPRDLMFLTRWMAKIVMPVINEFVRKSLVKRDVRGDLIEERLAALEAGQAGTEVGIVGVKGRVAALEERPIPQYAGIYKDGARYRACTLVTRGGGLWFAETPTRDSPGTPDSGWRLVVKEGRA